jgi:hypothetical protein
MKRETRRTQVEGPVTPVLFCSVQSGLSQPPFPRPGVTKDRLVVDPRDDTVLTLNRVHNPHAPAFIVTLSESALRIKKFCLRRRG